VLIFFRIVQGLAGAGMIRWRLPCSIASFQQKSAESPWDARRAADGGACARPSIGGYLVTFVSWRVIFYINVPIGILGFFMGAIFLRDIRAAGDIPLF